jgi:hypothetical protein
VDELNELLRPSWGAEKWILEGWNVITEQEKGTIKNRMDELFQHGLPFELKHDKILYIYAFSLLAQLEVLAIQIPLKFGFKMSTVEYKERMRQQLLDEIFHGLVFTKIVYMLCAPNATPPPYNESIEVLCNFIREVDCAKMAVMLLNLISEGWIEELFYSLERHGVAPKVFATIIDDEHRHVCEADLYKDIGMPDMTLIKPKLAFLEEQLLNNILMQYKYMFSVTSLLGVNGGVELLRSLDKKHHQQLQKIDLEPSENWQAFMAFSEKLLPKFQIFTDKHHEIEMSQNRKAFMTQWENPRDPTMYGQFNVNVSAIEFFEKKFPPETLTTLMMQGISKLLYEKEAYRSFLSLHKLYLSKEAYVGIVVKLPDCNEHLGVIIFENCHQFTARELAYRIRTIMKGMIYCYKKREQLEKLHPHLSQMFDKALYDFANDAYGYPMVGHSFATITNIGLYGFSDCMSPLMSNETLKFGLLEVERKQVYNKTSKKFEVQDLLPVSVTADHRVFDASAPAPKAVAKNFQLMFDKMIADESNAKKSSAPSSSSQASKLIDQLVANNVEMGYKLLLLLQTSWFDFLKLEELLDDEETKALSRKFCEIN